MSSLDQAIADAEAAVARWDREKSPNAGWRGVEALRSLLAVLKSQEQPALPSPSAVMTVAGLPEHSVVLDDDGDVWQLRGGLWCSYETATFPVLPRHFGPFRVLYTPEGESNG